MYHRPFLGELQRPARQFAPDYRQGPDVNRRFILTVPGVKVWRRVVIEEHSNQNPVEGADCWHAAW